MAVQLLDVQTSSTLVRAERSVGCCFKGGVWVSVPSLGVQVLSDAIRGLVLGATVGDVGLSLVQCVHIILLLVRVCSIVLILENLGQNASVVSRLGLLLIVD